MVEFSINLKAGVIKDEKMGPTKINFVVKVIIAGPLRHV